MNSAELGKRLKEARLAKKMTQSEVVGDFITRNMLSQIESGVATPSIKTLEYLANVLDVSLTNLMPDENEAARNEDVDCIIQAKQFILQGDFNAAVDVLDISSDRFSDEIYALCAIAFVKLAKNASDDGNLQQAIDYAKRAAELSDKGIYANETIKTESMLMLNSLAKRLSDYYAGMIVK